jgi:hypothetical protein
MHISEASRAELSTLLQSLHDRIGATDGSEEVQREADRHLEAVRDSFKRVIKHGKNDVFVRYLLEQLETLAADFVQASSKSVLRVTEHQFKSAQLLLDAFGDSKHLLRYTWRIIPATRLFEDGVWRKYFELTSSMAMSGGIDVRTMLILDNRRQCDEANIQKLLEFFATQERQTAKIVLNADWSAGMLDYAIPATCVEFGIYGENLLYQADSYTPVSVGSWSKDPIEIKRFTHCFDSIWSAPTIAANNPASSIRKVNLSQLMSADSVQERRQNPVHEAITRIEESIRPEAA